jgi:hypothetical protein
VPYQADYLAGVPPDASGLRQLEKGSYDNWRDVTVPVSDPSGTHTLWVNFNSDASDFVLELDWIRFNGQGVVE